MQTENRAQTLYWNELVQLKVDCGYIRRYRDRLATTVGRFAAARAVVSTSALAAWAVVKAHPEVWGGIIAASQVAEALQQAFGYTTRLRGATGLLFGIEALFIDSLLEWEAIFEGDVDATEITKRWHRLMTLRHELDRKHLPTPLPHRQALLRLAEAEATDYFKTTYQTEV